MTNDPKKRTKFTHPAIDNLDRKKAALRKVLHMALQMVPVDAIDVLETVLREVRKNLMPTRLVDDTIVAPKDGAP